MEQINLKKALNNINIKADWIWLREVNETTAYRVIRDLNPESNHTTSDHGIMVEVLVNGQFGYYATNNISYDSINNAAKNFPKTTSNSSVWSRKCCKNAAESGTACEASWGSFWPSSCALARLGRSCRARVPLNCRKRRSKSLFKKSFRNLWRPDARYHKDSVAGFGALAPNWIRPLSLSGSTWGR